MNLSVLASASGVPDSAALGWGLTVSVPLSLAQRSPMLLIL